MRLRLTLEHSPGIILPINYQYELSAAIYKIISRSDSSFSKWLHEHGYQSDDSGKRFKFFTFGALESTPYQLDRQQGLIRFNGRQTNLSVSFLIDASLNHFVTGLFQSQQFGIGNKFTGPNDFTVSNVVLEPELTFLPIMKYTARSPIFIKKNIAGQVYPDFLSPEDADYEHLLFHNLSSKQKTLNTDSFNSPSDTIFAFRLLSQPRSKLIRIKGSDIRAYLFDFELTAPPDWQRTGYYGGFGLENQQGFGLVEVIQNTSRLILYSF